MPLERVFNSVRPQYPIRKYRDVFGYNSIKKDVSMDIKTMLNKIKSKKKLTKNRIVVGKLGDNIVSFLEKRGVAIHTKDIHLTDKGLSHLMRESKKKRGAGLSEEDVLDIPIILKNPYKILFDNHKNKLNLLYCLQKKECSKLIKIVVDTKGIANRKEKITLIKTAGYINEYNVNSENYEDLTKRQERP